MAEKLSLLFPNQKLNFKTLSETTLHDIGMDNIVTKLTIQKNEQTYIYNVMKMMTDSPENARYRGEIFDDIMKNKGMRDKIVTLFDRINFLREYGSHKHDHDHEPGVWDLVHRLEELNDYIQCIDSMYACLKNADIKSEGLLKLRDYVHALYLDNGYDGLKKDIKALRANTQNLKSVTVGINLNERFEACGIGVVSINNKHFTKSHLVSHFIDRVSGKDNIQDGNEWKGDYKFDEFTAKNPNAMDGSFVIPAFSPMAFMSLKYVSEADETTRGITKYMDEITERMLSGTARHLRDVLGKYTMLTITDITDLMPEFIYYIRWAEYIEKLMDKGFFFCKPEVIMDENSDVTMNTIGVYNMKLLDSDIESTDDIVRNDLDFSDEHCIYLLTGANRGGKTTITQAVGQLFFMAQGGIYVTGTNFRYRPVDAIYTHFPADEDKTLDLGRLGEECKRFRSIYTEASENSLILLNETFSTTSFEEGYYIARDCTRALLGKGCRTIYNTHMHKLAYDVEELNKESDRFKAASLIVHSEQGVRSYKVSLAPPVGLSFAADIAKKYGVTYDLLNRDDFEEESETVD
ncbi:MutS-related protein [Butyrivibrio sp. WCD3002]|uniref:MutS-related protein n=1 Tax=Butyrivibrio sp. WCD3002 TaxID=1280676 RepID=UPI00047BF5CE|nr:DNA mismatch repair protein [Butyrivibrio sp. WCD3002]